MKYIDGNNDYYLRKGLELEKHREKLLEQYKRSHNPKTLELVKLISEQANDVWRTVRLRDFNKFYHLP
jgi:uncharacterized protein YnzC (UPF0291/DUF896 family)